MTENTALLDMTVGIVANYVTKNHVAPDDLPALIASIHAALSGVGEPQPDPAEQVDQPSAAQIRKSVSDAGIVSFIDGRTYQSLKRHLTRHELTPDEYRSRYGLPANYPMVAPAYAARRSELAKAAGLGQGGRKPKGAAKPAAWKPRAKA